MRCSVAPRAVPVGEVQAEAMPLAVVFKDRSILVIDKPPGLVVHPGAGNPRHTLQNALLALDPRLAVVPRAGLVHRLDKDTSGLLVIARTPEAHTALAAALAARQVTREYLALCTGVMTGGGTIDQPIGRHCTLRTRMTVRADGDSNNRVALGGPIFHGHAASGYTEKVHHPGNIFWYQAQQAHNVYQILDAYPLYRARLSSISRPG